MTVRCVDCELDGWLLSVLSCRHVVNPLIASILFDPADETCGK